MLTCYILAVTIADICWAFANQCITPRNQPLCYSVNKLYLLQLLCSSVLWCCCCALCFCSFEQPMHFATSVPPAFCILYSTADAVHCASAPLNSCCIFKFLSSFSKCSVAAITQLSYFWSCCLLVCVVLLLPCTMLLLPWSAVAFCSCCLLLILYV